MIRYAENIFWNEGTPAALVASLLSYDGTTGTGVVFEFQNLDDKVIAHLYFMVVFIAADKKEVRHTVKYSMLDVNAARGKTFGYDRFCWVPDNDIRKYEVIITKIVFLDDSIWENPSNEPLSPLDPAKPLSLLGEVEAQYRRNIPKVAQSCIAEYYKSWWRCGCGQINPSIDTPCLACSTTLISLLEAVHPDAMRAGQDKHNADIATLELNQKKRNKRILFSIAVYILVLAVISYASLSFVIIPGFEEKFEIQQDEQAQHEDKIAELQACRDALQPYTDYAKLISTGLYGTVGLCSDGTIKESQKDKLIDPMSWTDIVAVSADSNYVGLMSSGSVIVADRKGPKQNYALPWSDVIAISAGDPLIAGLRSDGTIVVADTSLYGRPPDAPKGSDFVAIAAGNDYLVGLRMDGTVAGTGRNWEGRLDVVAWTDIVAIAAGNNHTVGLRSDGTVVAVGSNKYGECNVSDWKNIVAIAASDNITLGLRSDGTVVAAGHGYDDRCDVSGWTDIVAISVHSGISIGLRSDGSIVWAGDSRSGGYVLSDWNLFDSSADIDRKAYRDGTYQVGKDIPPGEYLLVHAPGNGYFKISTDRSGSSAGTIYHGTFLRYCYVAIETDEYLILSGYTAYPVEKETKITDFTTIETEGVYKYGAYKVGVDIPAGEYVLTLMPNQSKGSYEISSAPFGSTYSLIHKESFDAETTVTLTEGQYFMVMWATFVEK